MLRTNDLPKVEFHNKLLGYFRFHGAAEEQNDENSLHLMTQKGLYNIKFTIRFSAYISGVRDTHKRCPDIRKVSFC